MLAGCTADKALVEPVPPVTVQSSNPACALRDDILAWLASNYQEAPVAGGVANVGGLVEILTTSDRATWTIVVTRPDGWACVVAAGEGWRDFEEALSPGMAL